MLSLRKTTTAAGSTPASMTPEAQIAFKSELLAIFKRAGQEAGVPPVQMALLQTFLARQPISQLLDMGKMFITVADRLRPFMDGTEA